MTIKMSSQVSDGSRLERIEAPSEQRFIQDYLQKNQPVVIRGGMQEWKALNMWTPNSLARRFGSEKVQVYGDLFRLAAITTLAEYLERYFGKDSEQATGAPYIRWYCRLRDDERVPWADDVFKSLEDQWARPTFFPSHSFVLPYCSEAGSIDPSRDWFPARGLFISARGARTRLHVDPWSSDALLCQIYGRKSFVMYSPSQAPYLTDGGRTVDIEAPDRELFPNFTNASPSVEDVLEPGEIVLVPAGWFHHFSTVSDSISLTWNFVHYCRLKEFVSYLLRHPPDGELTQLSYAYSNARAASSFA
jgi:hypothetical protein